MSRPSNESDPPVAWSTQPSSCSSVDLPQPEGPMIATYSPASTRIDTSRTASIGPAGIGNTRRSCRASTIVMIRARASASLRWAG